MNISALKAFAPAVRKQLIEAVSRKLDFALSARTPDYLDTYASQVRALRELAAADRKGLIERVAYTWFNRFAALRYLDARNWHPFHARVLMAKGAEDTLPEIFTMARAGAIPEGMRRYVNVARVDALLQGRIPSPDLQGEIYRLLVLAACRFYHGILPDVFEKLDDETELLLPDDLLTQQSVVQGFRTEITDDDCQQVEVLGWLYQFYISEKKDQVMARKAAVPSEDIPAVTQLFTPHWIVRYLVENSVGRLWLLNRPESLLRACMPYYTESESKTEFIRIARPQDIRLCDPAVGSGHMLTYAFDLLYVIYEEEGYAQSEISSLILKYNLTGIEIDCRAAQLASLALTLKAREKSPRFFSPQHFVRPNIIELRNVHFGKDELSNYSETLRLGELFTPRILQLMRQFEEAKTFGALIQPCVNESDIAFARGIVEARNLGSNLFLNETNNKVLRIFEQAQALTQRYYVVVANPPYMGSGNMNLLLKQGARRRYKTAQSNLFAMFIQRGLELVTDRGQIAYVTLHDWMFQSSYSELRETLLEHYISSFVHIGYNSFPELNSKVARAAAFVINKVRPLKSRGVYFDLNSAPQAADKQKVFEERLASRSYFAVASSEFGRIPGAPIAFSLSTTIKELFAEGHAISDVADLKVGLQTGDNEKFLRFWYEVPRKAISFEGLSDRRWVPYCKGGEFRKWFGNQVYVVDWTGQGAILRSFSDSSGNKKAYLRNPSFYFREAVEWSDVGQSFLGARYRPPNQIFDVVAMSLFPKPDSATTIYDAIAFLNTNIASMLLNILSPGMHYNTGYVSKLPYRPIEATQLVRNNASEAIDLAKRDWDALEISSGFSTQPLLRSPFKEASIETNWLSWQSITSGAIRRMRELETENNQIFIDGYGLQNELTAEIPERLITLARADPRRDVTAFLSYGVGCIMGRYSLDLPGLVLADPGEGIEEYLAKVGRASAELTFVPDRDGITPVLDDEWFADDIVARMREFLKATFGEERLRENVQFIEESLGCDLRAYLSTEFYKDHLQTYKKRPIYWMVQSPRKGFSALIYLHRYTRDTMNVILNRYLREFQVRLHNKIEQLQQVGTSLSASAREKTVAAKELTKLLKTLHECEEWERQTILPLAQARIELDLDDGVKVNYLKLGDALAPIPRLAAAEE
jgi:N-6 DNA Methylase